jgi:hypothetical protein
LSLPQSLPLPLSLSLSTNHNINMSLTNLSLYPIDHIQPVQFVIVTDTQPDPLTWIIYQGHLSTRCPTSPTHASTKHVPISPTYHHKVCVSTMYQTINLYHTKNQLCTTTCTINKCNHAPTMYQTVHQPCTNTCTKPCINHAPQPIPYASTINNVYQVPILYHTMYQPCTLTMLYHTMYQQCISTIYHITQSCHTPYTIGYIKQVLSMVYLNQLNNQEMYLIHVFHIPSVFLINVSISMTTIHHVPMLQQYTKDLPQACTITSSTCNPQNMHINIHVTL